MLREEIEKIQQTCPANNDGAFSQDDCPYYPSNDILCRKCEVDRICDLIGKVTERMPDFSKKGDWSHIVTEQEKLLAEILKVGARHQYSKCQAYWQKELGKPKPAPLPDLGPMEGRHEIAIPPFNEDVKG